MNFNSLILAYFDENKRDLPWRATNDPFKIWLSEIILQQTRVDQGMKFYHDFTCEFETIFDLAAADEQKVLRLWQGLGYYSRARNLHATAMHLAQECNGIFPTDFAELKKLKGIGDYTAAAIASIAFQQAVPAVDGNMYRVFSRYFNIENDLSASATKKIFWDIGMEVIDPKRPGDFNQAIMDLGATICTPKNFQCDRCPLNESCEALRLNKVATLPIKTKKTKVSNRFFHFIIMEDQQRVILSKRTGKDVWQNLYTFPLIETETDLLDHGWVIDKQLDAALSFVSEEKHILSHQNLFIKFWELPLKEEELIDLSTLENNLFVDLDSLDEFPFPKPIEKIINSKYFD